MKPVETDDRHRELAEPLRPRAPVLATDSTLSSPSFRELGSLPEEEARHRAVPGARLLDETGAERGGLGQRGVGENAAVHHLRHQQLVVVPQGRR